MNDLLHRAGIHHHRRDRAGERILHRRIEFARPDAQGVCETGTRRQEIADDRHGVVVDLFKQQPRAAILQRQHRAQFETRIDRPFDAMQLARLLEDAQEAAHALIGHRSSIRLYCGSWKCRMFFWRASSKASS